MTQLQKLIKYLAIAFGTCLSVGIIVGGLSLFTAITGVTSWLNGRDNSTVSADSTSLVFSDTVDRLELEVGAADIRILVGDELRVETDNPYISASETGSKLIIRERSHIANLEGSTLVLYIPQDMVFDKVEMSTGAGRLQLEELSCRELDWELGAGKAEMEKLTVTEKADIEGGAGQIVIHSGQLNNLDFDMGVGEGDIVAVLSGKSEITAGIGALYLTIPADADDYTVHAEQGIGRVEVDGRSITGESTVGSGSNRIELEGGIGNISVDFESQN